MSVDQSCLQTLTIPAGGTMVLPPGATVLYHDAPSAADLSTPCDSVAQQLENIGDRTCYHIVWETAGGGAPLDDAVLQYLRLGNLQYELRAKTSYINGLKSITAGAQPTYMNAGAGILAHCITESVVTAIAKVEQAICDNGGVAATTISVPASLGIPEIEIWNPDGNGGIEKLFLKGELSSSCTCNG